MIRPLSHALSAAVALCVLTSAKPAAADPMDPAIERLTLGTSPCVGSPPVPGQYLGDCQPDNASFKRLINQFGFALAPTAMHAARTTGFGGFHFSIEGAFTNADHNADYWQKGTQGPQDPNNKRFSTKNTGPDSLLQVYMLKIRKGFPFGLELTGNVGYLAHSSIVAGGADIRWSILEGFRTGVPGIFPDVAVGGGVRTITGTSQFQLTIASFDGQISKPLPIADSAILTPYVGYQYVYIFGDSGLIDFTPNTDPLGYCDYQGINVPGSSDPSATKKGVNDGQPVCPGGGKGSPLDFNNTKIFDNVRIARHRLIAGLNYRYEVIFLGGQFITDIVDPADANSDAKTKEALANVPRQWTMAFEVGAFF